MARVSGIAERRILWKIPRRTERAQFVNVPSHQPPFIVKRLVAFSLVGLSLAWASTAAAYEFADFTDAQKQLMQNGQCLVWTYEDPTSRKQFTCTATLMDAPLADVWALIEDKESSPSYFTNILASKIVGREGDSVLVYQETRPVGIAKSFKYIIRHHPTPYRRVDFERVSGDLRHIEGSWHFEPVEEGRKTLVVYQLHIDMGVLFPQALVVRNQKQRLPVVMGEIRKRLADLKEKAATAPPAQRPELVDAERPN